MIRDLKGRFASKADSSIKKYRKTVITLVLVGAVGFCNSVVYGVHLFDQYSPLDNYVTNAKKVFASEPTVTYVAKTANPSLNQELETLLEQRTQEMMKDPSNLKEYHDAIYAKVTKATNILTTTF